MSLAFLVPVRARPGNVFPLLDAICATSPRARVVFIADPGDDAECAAIRHARRRTTVRVDALTFEGNYAAKIRHGIEQTTEPLIFTGADDLKPRAGWLEEARKLLVDPVQVVGVNDLIERKREHATHFLMTRAYAEQPTIDGKPGPFFDGYSHWFCDDELIATATKRGAYAYAAKARVEHLHPMAGKAPDDEVYQAGRANQRLDRRLFRRRELLWT